jgi:hypothetical protein
MYRFTPVVVAASLLLLAIFGLRLAVQAAPTAEGPADGGADRAVDSAAGVADNAERSFRIFMSATADGAPQRSFLSGTHRVFAVIQYEQASNDRLTVEMRDLGGTLVKKETTPPLSGAGKHSVAASVEDFIASYRGAITTQGNALAASLDQASSNCASHPPVPPTWPPSPVQPTAQPGRPTPTPLPPDPYQVWLDLTLQEVKTSQFVLAAITPTVKSLQALPDLAAEGAINQELDSALASLNEVYRDLGTVEASLNPPQGRPDPDKGCATISDAKTEATAAMGQVAHALAALPADTSAWRLPPTSARYGGGVFQECVQYVTKMAGSTEATTAWSVGDPGPAALVFPRPDLVDGAHVGQLSPLGTLYAQSVTVPNVSHESHVSAFVTDAMCLPVDGTNITFGVDPSTAATVSPINVPVVDGYAEARLQAGNDAARRAEVHGVVCTGPCTNPGPGAPAPVVGRTRFDVIGPAKRMDFKVVPRTINPLADESAGISVVVTDAATNGLDVADGTAVRIRIEGPGTLYYDRRPSRGGRPTPVALGKTADAITRDGLTIVPPSDDPGFVNLERLYLKAGSDGDGCLTIIAEADGTTANTDALNAEGQRVKTVCIRSTTKIYLPSSMKRFNIYATPAVLPTTTPEPLQRR